MNNIKKSNDIITLNRKENHTHIIQKICARWHSYTTQFVAQINTIFIFLCLFCVETLKYQLNLTILKLLVFINLIHLSLYKHSYARR